MTNFQKIIELLETDKKDLIQELQEIEQLRLKTIGGIEYITKKISYLKTEQNKENLLSAGRD